MSLGYSDMGITHSHHTNKTSDSGMAGESQEEIMEIKETLDYEIFGTYTFNRPLNQNLVLVLSKSIQEYGFVMPILVQAAPKGSKYLILDGQHRFAAAREIGVAIPYIEIDIPDDIAPILISRVNSISQNWALQNFFDMWYGLCRPEYVKLHNFITDKGITLNELELFGLLQNNGRAAASGVDVLYGSGISKVHFQSGRYICPDQRYTIAAGWILKFHEILTYSDVYKDLINEYKFRRAVGKMVSHPGYDHDKMLGKLAGQTGKVQKQPTNELYVKVFSDIYNYQTRNHVDFNQRQRSRRKA